MLNKLAAERENAAIAIFITLEEPTKDMNREAESAYFFYSEAWGKNYLKIQTLTIDELFNGKTPDMPPIRKTSKQVKKEVEKKADQKDLF